MQADFTLYEALAAGVSDADAVAETACGTQWNMAAWAGGMGLAMNTPGDSIPAAHPEGGAAVTVRVAVESGIRISVSDNGPGIPESERQLVFQPFYRSSDTAAEGTGLGLPIVQEIARQHNATLTISDADPSATPPGACFTIQFQ